MENEPTINNHMIMMKELGEIKSSLAVNTNETSNIKARVAEMQSDVKETKAAVQFQNGRVTKIEEWANEAKKVIENTTRIANNTATTYKTDKTRIWAVIGAIFFLGGTIITLSIMAIDSKIKEGITQAIESYGK